MKKKFDPAFIFDIQNHLSPPKERHERGASIRWVRKYAAAESK